MEVLAGCIVLVAVAVIMAVVYPLLYAAGGYFTGWILSSVFTFAGMWIVNGAGAVGIEIDLTMLPAIGALLGFVGSFFKAHQSNTNTAKK